LDLLPGIVELLHTASGEIASRTHDLQTSHHLPYGEEFFGLRLMSFTGSVFRRAALMAYLTTSWGCGQNLPSEIPADPLAVARIRESLMQGVAATAGSETPGSAAEPTGYATLRGRFVLQGSAPAPVALNIVKDEAVCAPGGHPVYANELLVDPATQGIANVLIYAEGIPEAWAHEDSRPGKTDELIFDQKQCVFLTRMVAMQTSQKLRALNSDPVGHNLMVASFNQTIPAGGYAIYQPTKELRTPVKMSCAVHPWMTAWFINRDNSYYAVTGPDGAFEIPNLPAGVPLELRVWQEKLGSISNVIVDGSPKTWSKGKLSVTLEADTAQELNVAIDVGQIK